MKTETSGLDLHYILEELQFLVGGKVDKIYQDKKNLLISIHVTSKGRNLLNVIAPTFFYLASRKPEFPTTPKGFCTFLRKYLNNSRIKKLSQVAFERIVEIEFEAREQKYIMIIELFSKGNIILCKPDYTIMSAVETQRWSERTVRGGVKYEFPKREHNMLTMKENGLYEAISNSTKEYIVKMLAIDLGLGGVYAEEACTIAGVDKEKKKLSKEEVKKMFTALQKLKKNKTGAVITNNEEVFPFKLRNIEEAKPFDSFNKAIDSIITPKLISKKSEETISKHEKKIEKTREIIRRQETQVEKMEKSAIEHQRKGEIIYEKYSTVKEILEQMIQARKKFSWKEIKEKLKGHKMIKDINEKDSKITIEL